MIHSPFPVVALVLGFLIGSQDVISSASTSIMGFVSAGSATVSDEKRKIPHPSDAVSARLRGAAAVGNNNQEVYRHSTSHNTTRAAAPWQALLLHEEVLRNDTAAPTKVPSFIMKNATNAARPGDNHTVSWNVTMNHFHNPWPPLAPAAAHTNWTTTNGLAAVVAAADNTTNGVDVERLQKIRTTRRTRSWKWSATEGNVNNEPSRNNGTTTDLMSFFGNTTFFAPSVSTEEEEVFGSYHPVPFGIDHDLLLSSGGVAGNYTADDAAGQRQQTFLNVPAARGLNLPPQQGTTDQGNFLPGVYNYQYTDAQLAQVKAANFNSLRLGVNVETAHDPASLAKIRHYIETVAASTTGSDDSKVPGHGGDVPFVICMWDTLQAGEKGHGDGRVNDVAATGRAWKTVHESFKDMPNVLYEVFNEPFGYSHAEPQAYLEEMLTIVREAGLPKHRVILSGMGYADTLLAIADQWDGYLSWHMYPNWRPNGKRTQENYANVVHRKLKGVAHRTFITEFGANLALKKDYVNHYYPSGWGADGNVNMLRGLNDAVVSLRDKGQRLSGLFYWHGLDNQESPGYSYFGKTDGKASPGRKAVDKIMREFSAQRAQKEEEEDVEILFM